MRVFCSVVRFWLNLIRALLCAVRDNRTITIGIFKNNCYRQFPALHLIDLLEQQAGVLPLFCIPIHYSRSHGQHNAIQHSFYIGHKTLAGGTGIDPNPEFRDLDRGTRAPDDPDCEIFLCGGPIHIPHRITVFDHLGIYKLIAAGRADCRNDENI